ncbi:MAG TPA: VWA domain-containing protein [Thermoanaerobaculia bacterium]|nr:VWA domain-containing protein [Thermoanaerobaculia bacterium]
MKTAVLLGLCLAAPVAAQFTEVTEVTAVEIPVQVVLDGKPVRDLKPENFVVFQEKAKQPLIDFQMVDLYALPEEKAQELYVPVPARRHFLLLFDLAFSEPKAILQARAAAKDLLDGLHPTDLVGVATYASSKGSELVLGFTPDRAQVLAAIDSLGMPELLDRTAASDPLRLVVEELREDIYAASAKEAEFGASRGMKGMGDAMMLEQMEKALRASETADLIVQKERISSMTRSFAELAKLMRSVSGRKHVVYLSEGYDSAILMGTTNESDRKQMQEMAEHGEGGFIDPDKKYGNTDMLTEIERMLEELRRADCIVQAVDIAGLRAASGSKGELGYSRKGGKESLFQLARDTGGDLYENFNDLSAAMGKMLERTGVTYVLTIQPETAPDGQYHPLKVELRGGPKGARVVHRPGYFAPKPFAQRTRMERMLMTAGQVLVGSEGGAVQAKVLTRPIPGAPGRADVPLVIEIEGTSLLHLHQGKDLPTEIYVYALDEKGQVRDYIAQTLALDLFKLEGKLIQTGLRFYGHLELPPGKYAARVLVRNGRTGQYGLKVVPVEVPAFPETAEAPARPFFPELQQGWLVVREAPREGRRTVEF